MAPRVCRRGEVQFFYVNGVMNDDDGQGNRITDEIRKIFQNIGSKTPEIIFQYNDSATTGRVVAEIAGGVAGAIAVSYSVNQERKKKGNSLSRGVGILGLAAIVGVCVDYYKMQQDKNRIAEELAKKVSQFLKKNKSNVANLILHSQGADIGYRALELLSPLKGRIRVITLGAMTTIPDSMCAEVVNYKFNNDFVSNVAAFPFEAIRKGVDEQKRTVVYLNNEGSFSHSVNEYLKEGKIRKKILRLCSRS